VTASQITNQDVPSVLLGDDRETPRQAVEIALVGMATTWAVQHALTFGYRRLTGRDAPTARDADAPMRRILAWAAASAAAVAVANVVVDRVVLRPRSVSAARAAGF
jgi:Protein of unknown function (DUF4235)